MSILEVAQFIVASVRSVLATFDWAMDALTPTELDRAHSFKFDVDRCTFVAGHALARFAVAAWMGRDPWDVRIVQSCEHCGGPHGPPRVVGALGTALSISHSAGIVAVAVARDSIGIDIEQIGKREADEAVVASVMTDAECAAIFQASDPQRAFLRQWVRKEALVKAGLASLDTLRGIDLGDLPTPDGRVPEVVVPLGEAWPSFCVLDWQEPSLGIVGATVSRGPVRRIPWVPETSW